MGEPTQPSLRDIEAEIGLLMPIALDMIATVVESPGTSVETYDATLTVAEQNPPLLFLAILRAAAGLAAISELTGDDIRSLENGPAATSPAAGE